MLSTLAVASDGNGQTLPTTDASVKNNPTAPSFFQTSHGRIEIIREFIYPAHFEPPSIPLNFTEKKAADERDADVVTRKLWNIILPEVSFHGTRLADAVEFLRRESIRLDNDPSLVSRGVRISVQWRRPAENLPRVNLLPDAGTVAGTLITLSREHVPLMTVLSDLSMQAGMKFEVDRHGVLLFCPAPDSSGFVTLEIRVPPQFEGILRLYNLPGDHISVIDNAAAPPPPAPPKVLSFLKANGVQFQPGTAAVYLKATSKLVVRNTPDNINLVQALVEKAWQQSASSRPANTP